MVIDGKFPLLGAFRKRVSVGKACRSGSKTSVHPDIVRRIATAETREVCIISIGIQEERVSAGWTGHTISYALFAPQHHAQHQLS